MTYEIPTPDQEKSEKEKQWEEAARRVEHTVDKLGKPIDARVKETITSLLVLGINTTGSCEGHLDHGTGGPFVDIETGEISDLDRKLEEARTEEESEGIVQEIKRKNLEERRKILAYLEEFYKERQVPVHRQLFIHGLARGWSRLESQGVGLQEIEPTPVRQARLLEYQEEIGEFTNFLKRKFFE